MHLDDQVRVMYLTSEKGQHFTNGTDFRTLQHFTANHDLDRLANYLNDIFQLQATLAKVNKPVLTIAPGHAFNSGATMLAASGIPAVCQNTVLSFNECTFGFVPHAGTTYYASRLPGDLGTFLVLTGIPFSGQDAINFKLADKTIHVP